MCIINQEFRNIQSETLIEVQKNGCIPFDFERFNAKSPTEAKHSKKLMNLKKFQRAMYRLAKLAKQYREFKFREEL